MADKKFPIKPVFEYHGLKEDKDKIVVNSNLKLTKYPKYPEFEKVAGEDTIENLKSKWLDKIGPFPEPTVMQVLDDELKESGVKNDEQEDKAKKEKEEGRRLRNHRQYRILH